MDGASAGTSVAQKPSRLQAIRRRELAASAVSVGLGAVLFLAVGELRHAAALALSGDLHGLQQLFANLGAEGAALLFGLMLAHAVVWFPTELVTATAGLSYGFLPGLGLALSGWVASALLSYLLGRGAGEPLARLLFGARRVETFGAAVRRGGIPLLLTARLVPIVPFSLTGYVAGAARIGLWRFTWTTAVGYLPLCALVAYLGAESRTLSSTDPRLWLGLGAIALLLAASRALRRVVAIDPDPDSDIETS
jgi:uncharacterized membrane protein YdjX (TVP38/TMEM64 family)